MPLSAILHVFFLSFSVKLERCSDTWCCCLVISFLHFLWLIPSQRSAPSVTFVRTRAQQCTVPCFQCRKRRVKCHLYGYVVYDSASRAVMSFPHPHGCSGNSCPKQSVEVDGRRFQSTVRKRWEWQSGYGGLGMPSASKREQMRRRRTS